jgi:protein phosphatase
VVQVGDSRCYYWHDEDLQCMTHDQTIAQDLVDAGVLEAERAAESPLSNVLSSALGASEARPVVSTMTVKRGCAMVLCTDGLIKHVSDQEIAAHLRTATSSEQACRALVDLALERVERTTSPLSPRPAPPAKLPPLSAPLPRNPMDRIAPLASSRH